MKTEKKDHGRTFLFPTLAEQCDPRHPLKKLGERMAWQDFEEAFAGYYSEEGRPAKAVRLMVGLLLLKQMFNQSDEAVVERWKEKPYWQEFCRMVEFQWELPCDSSDLVYFRNRIGEQGVTLILAISARMHGKKCREAEVVIDSMVQEPERSEGRLPQAARRVRRSRIIRTSRTRSIQSNIARSSPPAGNWPMSTE